MSQPKAQVVYGPWGAALVSAVLSFISAWLIRVGLVEMMGTSKGATVIAVGIFLGEFGIMLAVLGTRDALMDR